MDYCNGVKGFINYSPSNLKNISGCDIKCSYKRCKNKNFIDLNVLTMHLLQKKIHRKILVLVYIRRTTCSLQYLNFQWKHIMYMLGYVQTYSIHSGHLLYYILVDWKYSWFTTCHRGCVWDQSSCSCLWSYLILIIRVGI